MTRMLLALAIAIITMKVTTYPNLEVYYDEDERTQRIIVFDYTETRYSNLEVYGPEGVDAYNEQYENNDPTVIFVPTGSYTPYTPLLPSGMDYDSLLQIIQRNSNDYSFGDDEL